MSQPDIATISLAERFDTLIATNPEACFCACHFPPSSLVHVFPCCDPCPGCQNSIKTERTKDHAKRCPAVQKIQAANEAAETVMKELVQARFLVKCLEITVDDQAAYAKSVETRIIVLEAEIDSLRAATASDQNDAPNTTTEPPQATENEAILAWMKTGQTLALASALAYAQIDRDHANKRRDLAVEASLADREALQNLECENRGLEQDKIDLQYQLTNAKAALEKIYKAVRIHRDMKGDDRCWRDNESLYGELPEGYQYGFGSALPPKSEFLESCRRSCEQFWQNSQSPATKLWVARGHSPDSGKTIRQLEDELAETRIKLGVAEAKLESEETARLVSEDEGDPGRGPDAVLNLDVSVESPPESSGKKCLGEISAIPEATRKWLRLGRW
jgi:hypothetical protein